MVEVTQEDLDKYHIDGIDHMLVVYVCKMLKHKWQVLNDYEVNMPRMIDFFKSDRDTLIKIIKWYESNLIDTTFTING